MIVTKNSTEKGKPLRGLVGVDHVVNRRREVTKGLAGGIGIHFVVEVAEALTIK